MTENFDSALRAKQEELESLKLHMEETRLQFVRKSAEFIANWYEETAKGFVAEESEHTLAIGKEKLSEMKGKVKELVTQAQDIASEALSQPSTWWHLATSDLGFSSPYEQYGDRIPEIVDKPIRRALGKLGTILEMFGYRVNTKPVETSSEWASSWYERPSSSETGSMDAVPYYPYHYTGSKEMQTTLKSYNELYKQAYQAYFEIKDLQKRKKKQEAADLWRSA